jgi:hypothetical protein
MRDIDTMREEQDMRLQEESWDTDCDLSSDRIRNMITVYKLGAPFGIGLQKAFLIKREAKYETKEWAENCNPTKQVSFDREISETEYDYDILDKGRGLV